MAYELQSIDVCCGNCEHKSYDSFHGEQYCGHEPPPDDLPSRLIVRPDIGYCEFFSSED